MSGAAQDPPGEHDEQDLKAVVWRMRDSARLRRAASAVRRDGAFRLGDEEVPVSAVADWLERAADAYGAWERDGSPIPDSALAVALAFAEALPLVIVHEPIIAPQPLRGARRNGTHLACTCGDRFGIVSNEAPSRGGRATAVTRHQAHLRDVEAARDGSAR